MADASGTEPLTRFARRVFTALHRRAGGSTTGQIHSATGLAPERVEEAVRLLVARRLIHVLPQGVYRADAGGTEGLTEEERVVYTAICPPVGLSSAEEVMADTGLSRQGVTEAIRSLLDRGYIYSASPGGPYLVR
jgi:hypothetical protein